MRRSPALSRTQRLYLGAALLGFGTASPAAEWYAEPSVSVQGIYNTNIRLFDGPHRSVSGVVVAPLIAAGVRSEIRELSGSAQLRSSRYHPDETLDSDDRFYTLKYRELTQRGRWQVTGSYVTDSLITGSEFDADGGLLSEQRQRTTGTVTPSWTHSITEKLRLSLNGQYSEVTYDAEPGDQLYDYRRWRGGLKLGHQHTTRTEYFVSASYTNFENRTPGTISLADPSFSKESGTTYYQLGVTWKPSQTTELTLSGGTRRTTTERVVITCTNFVGPFCTAAEPRQVTQTSTGTIFDVSLEKTFYKSRLTLAAGKTVKPSASGTELETDSIHLVIEYPLGPLLTSSLVASGYRYRATSEDADTVDRNYYRIEPRLSWRLDERWTLDASYQFSQIRYINRPDFADSHAGYLSLTYRFARMATSL